MSNYSSSLKTWGATGSEYPDGYSYVAGDQPVDAWDNFVTDNLITDVQHLISLTNDRLESDVGTAPPGTLETGHMFYDSADDTFNVADSSGSLDRMMKATGDEMTGVLDMNGYQINDTSGRLTLNAAVTANGSQLETEWFRKQEGGTVTAGNSVVLVTAEVPDGSTFSVTQAHLSEDGWNTPANSGIDLVISAQGTAGKQATIFTGDGATFYENTGAPLASYTNSTGSAQQVAVLIDNGEYGTGSGSDDKAYGGVIARVN